MAFSFVAHEHRRDIDLARQCFTTHCIMAEITSYLGGDDLVQFSRASKWLYFSMWGSPFIWKKALGRVNVDVDLAVTPFRTLYTLSILWLTNDCMLCGHSTRNGILGTGEAATRLCNKCAVNVLVPAPDADQPPQFMQTLYHGGPHRHFKMTLRHGASRVRIPALQLHARPATLYRASRSAPKDPNYLAGSVILILRLITALIDIREQANRYLQRLMNNVYEGKQPQIPVRSLKISTIGSDYVALLPLSRGY
ncbi:unnamed protein product [Rhizoctonia solani]|uniref:Uncharacterized protein n=1 Tax=Rhizoctonia solani TaxID=456999 RepID=A0A8H3DNI3_9AGAM|nr:unnamed protein product [Rhizoctonia solani]